MNKKSRSGSTTIRHDERSGTRGAPKPRTAIPAAAATGGRVSLLAAAIIGVGLVTYGNSLGGQFLYDDETAIVTNQHLRHLLPLREALGAAPNTPLAGRPVVSLSFALNYAAGGLNPWSYHAVNIAIHILAALVLFAIVRRTLTSGALRARFGGDSAALAFASALIWLVHPLQTGAVTYITQRTELFAGLFYLLTLYGAIRVSAPGRGGVATWTVVSGAACALGMASKEIVVTAPVTVVLYDWVFGGARHLVSWASLRARLVLYGALASTWLILWALLRSGPRTGTVGFSAGVTPLAYAANQCLMIVHYLRLTLWPHPLILDYGPPPPVAAATVAPYAAVVVALIAATLLGLRLRSPVGFLGAWVFLILAPTSSIVPIASEVGAERRMYLPLAGIVVFAVVGGWLLLERLQLGNDPSHSGSLELASSPKMGNAASENEAPRAVKTGRATPRVAAGLVAAVGVALAWTSAARNAEYRSPEGMWRSVLAHRPHWRAHNNLGVVLTAEGRYAEAVEEYRQALRGNPGSLVAHYNLGYDLDRIGQGNEAIAQYREFLKLRPEDVVVRNLLGARLAERGETEAAADEFRAALRLDPGSADAHGGLGNLLLEQQQFAAAADHLRRFLAAHPDDEPAENKLGLALVQQGLEQEALAHFRRAVDLGPASAPAQFNFGLALLSTGRLDEGRRHLREAVRLDPGLRPPVEEALAGR